MKLSEIVEVMTISNMDQSFEVIQYGDKVDYIRRYGMLDLIRYRDNIDKLDAEIESIRIPGARTSCTIYLKGRFDPDKEGFKCFKGMKIRL